MKNRKRQTKLPSFGLEIAKQNRNSRNRKHKLRIRQFTLDKYGLTTTQVAPKQVGQVEPPRVQLAHDLFEALRTKKYKQIHLGKGREFEVFDLRGLKYGVVMKKQKRPFAPRKLDSQIQKAKEHSAIHKEWSEQVKTPQLFATQIRFGKRPAYIFERAIPFVRTDFKRCGRKLIVLKNRARYCPVEDVCRAMPGIVGHFRVADSKKLLLDTKLENLGVGSPGILFLDTFHKYSEPVELNMATKSPKEMGLNQYASRFLQSSHNYYKSGREKRALAGALLNEVERQFGIGRANSLFEFLVKTKVIPKSLFASTAHRAQAPAPRR